MLKYAQAGQPTLRVSWGLAGDWAWASSWREVLVTGVAKGRGTAAVTIWQWGLGTSWSHWRLVLGVKT